MSNFSDFIDFIKFFHIDFASGQDMHSASKYCAAQLSLECEVAMAGVCCLLRAVWSHRVGVEGGASPAW